MANRKITADKLKKHVKDTFDHIRKALDIRERLLTRQIDVLATNPTNHQTGGRHINLLDQMKFIPDNESNVLNGIRIFGKFNIDNYNFYNDTTFAIEDYICPSVDHELMYKCLNSNHTTTTVNNNDSDNSQPHDAIKEFDDQANERQQVVENEQQHKEIDNSHNKRLINANNQLKENIVNMTVSESKELIAKSSNLTKFEEFMYDGLTTSSSDGIAIDKNIYSEPNEDINIANLLINNLQQEQIGDTQQTTPSATTNAKKSKRKIKINNYNGTINLKNISSLTINTGCNREPSVKQQSKAANGNKLPLSKISSNKSASLASSHGDQQYHHTDADSTSYNCEFYNRLLNEIKNSFSNTVHADHSPTTIITNNNNVPAYDSSNSPFSSSTTSSNSSSSSSSSSSSTSSSSSSPAATNDADGGAGSCNKMMFRNIRNLKINIPVTAMKNRNSNDQSSATSKTLTSTVTQLESLLAEPDSDESLNHPVHIEHWLKQIILETETEPMQNTDILEHSILHSKQMLNANIIAAAITTGKM